MFVLILSVAGATSELGSALTRLCLRQKGIEEKFKSFSRYKIKLNPVSLTNYLTPVRVLVRET